jgi:hypothetical protein
MAASSDAATVALARRTILTACEGCGLAVASEPVPGAIAPPMRPDEARRWLHLAANAFKAAGWALEAGQLLLSMGPERDGGRYYDAAKRLLHAVADKAAVAQVYERAGLQQMGLSSGGSAGAAQGGTAAESWDAATPAAGSGSSGFLSASKLLHDALRLYVTAGCVDDAWRLLQQHEGLTRLLRDKEVDDIALVGRHAREHGGKDSTLQSMGGCVRVSCPRRRLLPGTPQLQGWINASGAKVPRSHLLVAIQSLSKDGYREEMRLGKHDRLRSAARSTQSTRHCELAGAPGVYQALQPQQAAWRGPDMQQPAAYSPLYAGSHALGASAGRVQQQLPQHDAMSAGAPVQEPGTAAAGRRPEAAQPATTWAGVLPQPSAGAGAGAASSSYVVSPPPAALPAPTQLSFAQIAAAAAPAHDGDEQAMDEALDPAKILEHVQALMQATAAAGSGSDGASSTAAGARAAAGADADHASAGDVAEFQEDDFELVQSRRKRGGGGGPGGQKRWGRKHPGQGGASVLGGGAGGRPERRRW